MEWQLVLLLVFSLLVILMLTGMPVAFCFLLINVVGVYVFYGGLTGLEQLISNMYTTLNSFILLPIPLFIFMGEIMFHSGIASLLIQTVDKWLGRMPGRLSLVAVGTSTILSTLTGTSMASVAVLGSILVPEMEKRGYQKCMSLGPILGSGALAVMIPPSALAVLLGAIGQISIGRILIAIILPGLLMAAIFTAYIIIRCRFQPNIAPAYEVTPAPLFEKIMTVVRYVLPLGIVIFLVVGVIFLGIATPSEAAATGAFGMFILTFIYKRMSWSILRKALTGTLMISGMLFLIMSGAIAFSQILAYSGASQGLTEVATQLPVAPVITVIIMMVIVVFLGGFMDVVAIMMITLPIFVPVITALGFNPVWFAVIFLINVESSSISPPFGLCLFTMKGVAPPDTTMGDVYKAALPFLILDLIAMAIVIAFPQVALWLPGMMW